MIFCIADVEYGAANAVEWCVDNEILDGRNSCASDEECLQNGKVLCDSDPTCFGIAWYTNLANFPLKKCKSKTMGPKTDGWHTMMKQGIYLLSVT